MTDQQIKGIKNLKQFISVLEDIQTRSKKELWKNVTGLTQYNDAYRAYFESISTLISVLEAIK